MAGDLKRLISTRGNYRGQVNTLYSDLSKFKDFDVLKRANVSSKLSRLKDELGKLDPQICELKWKVNDKDESKAEQENEKELQIIDQYSDKLAEMSNYLKSLTPASTTANAQHFQSMLKSPTAPLPTFASSEGENFIKFFKQFEETTNRFHYSDYDKLILLKELLLYLILWRLIINRMM